MSRLDLSEFCFVRKLDPLFYFLVSAKKKKTMSVNSIIWVFFPVFCIFQISAIFLWFPGAFPEQVKRGGIWSEIKSGKIVENGKETLVCVKLYTVRTSAMHLVTEELQLR